MSWFRRAAARVSWSWLPVFAGVIALGIGCYQLSLPNVLGGVLGYNLGYDDGVYVGGAIRLVHGVLPYKDFVFVHPPGIMLLLSPFAALGTVTSERVALELARSLTVVVVAANAVLVGRLVRRLGPVAAGVASLVVALWPLTVAVDRTVELEPFLVFFTLSGSVVLLAQDDTPTPRRTAVGGALLGLALVTKVWAILPIAAMILVWLPRWRRELKWLIGGLAVGALVPCLPFFLAAPHAFLHDVVVAQLSRTNMFSSTPLLDRFLGVSGLTGLTAFTVNRWVAGGLFIVLGLVVGEMFGLHGRRRSRLEWYVLTAAVVTFVGMFTDPLLYDHYAYFPAVLLAPLVGVTVARALSLFGKAVRKWRPRRKSEGGEWSWPRGRAILGGVVLGGAVAAAVGFFVQQDEAYGTAYLSEASDPSDLAQVIPAGACVVSDFPSDLIVAGRFTPARSGCPAVVDPFGLYLADDNGTQPHLEPPLYSVDFSEQWLSWLSQADYVELRGPFSDFIPWKPYMIRWFDQNYRTVAHLSTVYSQPFIDIQKDMYVYRRVGS